MRVPGLSLTTTVLTTQPAAQRRKEVDRGALLSHELRQALTFGVDLTMGTFREKAMSISTGQ